MSTTATCVDQIVDVNGTVYFAANDDGCVEKIALVRGIQYHAAFHEHAMSVYVFAPDNSEIRWIEAVERDHRICVAISDGESATDRFWQTTQRSWAAIS